VPLVLHPPSVTGRWKRHRSDHDERASVSGLQPAHRPPGHRTFADGNPAIGL
jgi:hypothetical protein